MAVRVIDKEPWRSILIMETRIICLTSGGSTSAYNYRLYNLRNDASATSWWLNGITRRRIDRSNMDLSVYQPFCIEWGYVEAW